MEIIKHKDENKIKQWEMIHDKRKNYICHRCGCEWRCHWSENKFGSVHDYNGDPDILCPECGSNDTNEKTRPDYRHENLQENSETSRYVGCKNFDHDDYNCYYCVNPAESGKSCFK